MSREKLCDQIALEFHHIPIDEHELAENESPLAMHVNGETSITNDILNCMEVPVDMCVDELCRLALMNVDPELVEELENA